VYTTNPIWASGRRTTPQTARPLGSATCTCKRCGVQGSKSRCLLWSWQCNIVAAGSYFTVRGSSSLRVQAAWTVKAPCCFETSGNTNPATRCDVSDDLAPQLQRCWSVECWTQTIKRIFTQLIYVTTILLRRVSATVYSNIQTDLF
jgi:hypothetical protein